MYGVFVTSAGVSFSCSSLFLYNSDADYVSEEVVESVKDEKRRKHMEAISEELFNNEQ